jgi:probable HAF family extracellular repeat protein
LPVHARTPTTVSRATAINDLGQVTGDADTSAGLQHAFRWTAFGGMRDLGTLGGTFSSASGINDLGQVAGGAQTADDSVHAFRWMP